MTKKFADVKVGDHFIYDKETFVKSGKVSDSGSHGIAWSIRNGNKYKEWAFKMSEEVAQVSK